MRDCPSALSAAHRQEQQDKSTACSFRGHCLHPTTMSPTTLNITEVHFTDENLRLNEAL